MPVAPTYPGVYIEELPSGVRTITGVSTSVTAFLGYTLRGPIDDPVYLFSFGDFERAFGGLAFDSAVSYAVRQFFQNGGSEAWVVRVALNAVPAAVTPLRGTAAGSAEALRVTTCGAGAWGNLLRIGVDYDTQRTRPACSTSRSRAWSSARASSSRARPRSSGISA